MTFTYTQSNLQSRLNAGIQGKIGMLVSPQDTMNQAVRMLFATVDLRSARRRQTLTPNLYNGIFDYACPTDLKGYSIIDIPAQAARQDGSFFLVPTEEFEVKKEKGMIALDDFNGTRTLKINSSVVDHTITISELDSLTSGGGTWVLFGDATTLASDTDDFVKGSGSIKFNISAAGGTTAGIQNTGLNSFDLTDYLGGNSSVFVWHRINSTTGITSYTLRIGSSSSNYYSKTVTAQSDGTAFVSGWNLFRFDLTSLTETGSVTDTAITFSAVYMTKLGSKISESDYKFDCLVLKRGVTHYVKYFSKFGWTNSSGTYLENSTAVSDLLVADSDEFELITQMGRCLAAQETDLSYNVVRAMRKDLDGDIMKYQQKNPSEAKIFTNSYYKY